jgi:crotonobetainyl-CoA:carnitine CoA-transferase CaiB-like acyl-CoA transferase
MDGGLTDWLVQVMHHLHYIGIFLLVALARVFPPLPSESVIPLAGIGAATGEFSLVGIAVAGGLGSLAGQLVWFLPSRLMGRERLREINPRLVHASLSGWGYDGPYATRAGHDLNYMAVGGGLDASGLPDRPVISYLPVADFASAQHTALAVAGALLGRERTGQGCFLDLSIMESVLGWQGMNLTAAARGTMPKRSEALLSGGAACYRIYRTADGRFVTLSALEAKFWANFCEAVGRPDWIARQEDPMPQTDLTGELDALFATRTLAEWKAQLDPVDCCFEAVPELTEVPAHPHIAARGQVRVTPGPEPLVETLMGLRVDGAPPPARAPLRESDAAAVLAGWE